MTPRVPFTYARGRLFVNGLWTEFDKVNTDRRGVPVNSLIFFYGFGLVVSSMKMYKTRSHPGPEM